MDEMEKKGKVGAKSKMGTSGNLAKSTAPAASPKVIRPVTAKVPSTKNTGAAVAAKKVPDLKIAPATKVSEPKAIVPAKPAPRPQTARQPVAKPPTVAVKPVEKKVAAAKPATVEKKEKAVVIVPKPAQKVD